jgi:hypothetical protein
MQIVLQDECLRSRSLSLSSEVAEKASASFDERGLRVSRVQWSIQCELELPKAGEGFHFVQWMHTAQIHLAHPWRTDL